MPTANSWSKSFLRQLNHKVLLPLEDVVERGTADMWAKVRVCDQMRWVVKSYYDGYRHKYNSEPDLPISERWLRDFYFMTREMYQNTDQSIQLTAARQLLEELKAKLAEISPPN